MKRLPLTTMAIILALLVGVCAHAQDSVDVSKTATFCLDYNPYLKSVQKELTATEFDKRSAQGGYLPQVDVNAGWGIQRYNSTATRAANREDVVDGRTEASLIITQLIWDGNGQFGRIDYETARIGQAENRLYDGAEYLALEAIIAHIDVLAQQELVALAEQNVAKHEEILGNITDRQQVGASSLADVTQAQGRLSQSKVTLTTETRKLRDAIAAYERLVGQPPMELTEPGAVTGLPANMEAAVEATVGGNYQLAAKKSELQMSEEAVTIAKSTYYPTIYLEGKSEYTDHVQASTSYTREDYAMVKAEWNLYNGGADQADIEGSLDRKTKTRQELLDLKDDLVKSTYETWNLLQEAKQNLANNEEALLYTTDTRDMYLQQFDVGQRTLLDVLDAENEVFTSHGRMITAKYNVAISSYRLLALEGQLLPALGLDPENYKQYREVASAEEAAAQ